jgi:hypothetical protein
LDSTNHLCPISFDGSIATNVLTGGKVQIPHPDPFLTVRVENAAEVPSFTGWCAGFENGKWRDQQLAKHLMEWLPEFALRYTELASLNASNAVPLLSKAAHAIYNSPKFQSRGEFGEILLHVMIRQHFHTIPAISKYFYKDSSNDTVKGFDAVHVVPEGNELELWLGEVKFYQDLGSAINDVALELEVHTKRDYLRSEFAAILSKIDPSFPYAKKLNSLLHRNTSLDQVFARICIPVLITYDSDLFSKYTSVTSAYEVAFTQEIGKNFERVKSKVPRELSIRVLLFPLKSKRSLVAVMDEVLKSWQKAA